jgi:hypothetical protein
VRTPFRGKCIAEVNGSRRLTDAALLISNSKYGGRHVFVIRRWVEIVEQKGDYSSLGFCKHGITQHADATDLDPNFVACLKKARGISRHPHTLVAYPSG